MLATNVPTSIPNARKEVIDLRAHILFAAFGEASETNG